MQQIQTTQQNTVIETEATYPIFIGDLDQNITEDQLLGHFSKYGQIKSIVIKKEKNLKTNKNFAFLNFQENKLFDQIISEQNGGKIGNCVIRVSKYTTKEERDSQQGNIFVKNLTDQISIQDLSNYFNKFGEVQSVKIKSGDSNKASGYGYVQFKDKSASDNCMNCEKHEINSVPIVVEKFVSAEERLNNNDGKTVFIKNIPNYSEQDQVQTLLQEKFKIFGEIQEIQSKFDTIKQKYVANLTFHDKEAADKALGQNNLIKLREEDTEYLAIQKLASKEQRHNEQNSTNLYARGLKETVTEQQFRDAFQRFGKITSLVIKHPSQSNQIQYKTLYAQFSFENSTQSQTAIIQQSNFEDIKDLFQDRKPYLSFALNKEQKSQISKTKMNPNAQNFGLFSQQLGGGFIPANPFFNPLGLSMVPQQNLYNTPFQQFPLQQNPFSYPQQQPQQQPWNQNNNNFNNQLQQNYRRVNTGNNYNNNNQNNYQPNNYNNNYQQNNNYNRNYNNNQRGGYNSQNNNNNYQQRRNNNDYRGNQYQGGQRRQDNYNKYEEFQVKQKIQQQDAQQQNIQEQQKNQSSPPTVLENLDKEAMIQKYNTLLKSGEKGRETTWRELGVHLFPKIQKILSTEQQIHCSKITGMLVDLENLDVEEIVDLIVDQNSLKESVDEAISLINSSTEQK